MRLAKRTVRPLAAGLAAALLLPLNAAVSESAPTPARTVHAAPDGRGEECSAEAPCGLTGARDAARKATGQGDVTVELAGGRYRLAEPLALTSEDSGRDGHRVTWRAAPGAEPVFDGGVPVEGWKRTDEKKNVWTAPLPEGASGARQMYVDGERAVRARSAACGKDDCEVTEDGITGADKRFASFAHPEDLEAVTAVQWRDFRCGVAEAAKGDGGTSTSTLTLDQPCWNNQALKTQTGWESASPSSSRYHGIDWFENAYELLGTPGQFYVDERKRTVSYVPREGEDMALAEAVLPRAEQLLTVKGTLDEPVTGLTFEGIGFEHTTWRRPSTRDGYVSGQAGHYVDGAPTGTQPGHGEQYPRIRTAVEVEAARDVTFRDGTWQRLGAGALDLSGGTSGSTVERSTFTDLSGGAVFVGDTKARPGDPRSRSRDNVVRRNEITHVAREFRDNVGIFGGYNDGLAVDHNTVTHLPYTAISVGWGWDFVGDKDVQRDVVVSHNRIHDHMRTLRDGAGIYTQGQSPGSKVYANDIDTEKSPTGNGIYHDERSRHWTTQNNVVWSITDHDLEKTDVKWLSAWASWGGYNIARDNWTDDPRPGKSGTEKNTFAPNHLGLTELPSAARKVVEAAGHDAPEERREVRFVAPRDRTAEGVTDIEVTAPYDTRTVRFSVDGTALSEMTRQYADGTGEDAEWRVAANADWLPPGTHTLRAEAVTAQGTVTAERRIEVRGGGSPSALNGTWKFAVEDELPEGALDGDLPPAARPGFDESAMTPVQVPSSFGAVRARWNDHEGQVSAYRKTFRQPGGDGGRVSLVAESCFFECRYFVNGEQVGTSTGGYLPERLDVTEAVRDGDNQLTVLVDNRKKETIAPYGINQDLYWNWGGLQDEVRVERTREAEVTHVTAQGAADGTLELRASGVNATGGTREVPARVRVAGLDRKVTFELPEGGGESRPVKLKVDDPELWTLENPRLYDVRVTPDSGGRALTTRTGFRTVEAEDGEVLLNGHAVKNLKGFNRHADHPGLGRTDPAGLSRRELRKLHDDGFRLFRPGHYPTTPALLDAADELGFLVVEEINVTQAKKEQLASEKTRAFARDRLDRMVRRDRGHPSVVTWSVGNENHTQTDEGAAYVRDMIAHGRERDPSRLYTEVSAWHTDDKSYAYQDVILANIYSGWYYGEFDDVAGLTDAIQKKAGGKPLVVSEYGAEAVRGRPGDGKGTERYQAELVAAYGRQLDDRPKTLGTMYWPVSEFMLTPEGGGGNPVEVRGFHNKGLLTWFREPKEAYGVLTGS
ncbi:glycoside hydrolase family 2 TIM barrel-domain containing protein [Streptomyces sp. NPDC048172]|uniref:glycoside hydrolase family 2 TIM barrel-domain containing protein n=1 Tax=Streptomyces sp. NPDC048172 TaxID=3365505 RepID=UPI0037209BF4